MSGEWVHSKLRFLLLIRCRDRVWARLGDGFFPHRPSHFTKPEDPGIHLPVEECIRKKLHG